MLSYTALLNWLKVVYQMFGQSNMHHTQTNQEGIECTKAKEFVGKSLLC